MEDSNVLCGGFKAFYQRLLCMFPNDNQGCCIGEKQLSRGCNNIARLSRCRAATNPGHGAGTVVVRNRSDKISSLCFSDFALWVACRSGVIPSFSE